MSVNKLHLNTKWIKHLFSADWFKVHCTLNKCKQIHAFLLRNHLFQNNYAVSKIISFCAISQTGDLNYARKVFAQIEKPDMFIWNTMIRGYARSNYPEEALTLFYLMLQSGVLPDKFTFPFVLTACACLPAPELGRRFHGEIIKSGLELDVFVMNSLVRMYASSSCLDAAFKVFHEMPERDVVSWNVMIGGCVQRSLYGQAFELFERMTQMNDLAPDEITMISVISACTHLGDLERGKFLHSYSKIFGLNMSLNLGNAILDMYCKCGDFTCACQLFDEMPEKDVLSWTSMISGYANAGCCRESLILFSQMQYKKIKPDCIALVSALSACAQSGALDQGKYIHLCVERYKVKQDIMLETALVDMYGKCGSIHLALQVFEKMNVKNVFSWNAMIGGLAMHGHGQQAMDLFGRMKNEGMMPDDVTFIGVLCGCSHAGLVNEGFTHFRMMKEVYKIQPRMEHYGCMVDLLCRARLMDDALVFIENMPIKPNVVLWASLLGACKIHGDFKLAEEVGKHIIELEPNSCGRYVLLSNLYAGVHKWDDAVKIRTMMKEKGIEKIPGFSWIEVDGMVHQFVAGDRSHVQTEQIYMMVEEMCQKVKLVGHVVVTSNVLFDVDEEEKEHSLYLHSEKLAIAFGLISTPPGSLIRIVKNLRVCDDCHSFVKIVSKVFNREIIARDRSRFHHFREGLCSCMDFW